MKEKIKIGMNHFKQRTRFFQGLMVGLFIMSALSYAGVTLTTFTPNTTISATAMNANFTAIANKLNELDVGFVARLTTSFELNACASSSMFPAAVDMEVVEADLIDQNDGNFNTSTWEYTIPATGIYRIYAEGPSTLSSTGYDFKLGIYTSGTWAQEYISGHLVRRFIAGQKVRVLAGCGTKFPNSNTTPAVVDAAKFVFALKKF